MTEPWTKEKLRQYVCPCLVACFSNLLAQARPKLVPETKPSKPYNSLRSTETTIFGKHSSFGLARAKVLGKQELLPSYHGRGSFPGNTTVSGPGQNPWQTTQFGVIPATFVNETCVGCGLRGGNLQTSNVQQMMHYAYFGDFRMWRLFQSKYVQKLPKTRAKKKNKNEKNHEHCLSRQTRTTKKPRKNNEQKRHK